jgi:hypothetical protein
VSNRAAGRADHQTLHEVQATFSGKMPATQKLSPGSRIVASTETDPTGFTMHPGVSLRARGRRGYFPPVSSWADSEIWCRRKRAREKDDRAERSGVQGRACSRNTSEQLGLRTSAGGRKAWRIPR